MKYLIVASIIFIIQLILLFNIVNYINVIEHYLFMKNKEKIEQENFLRLIEGIEPLEYDKINVSYYVYVLIFLQLLLILENLFNLTKIINKTFVEDG